jgi:hypothetical protein
MNKNEKIIWYKANDKLFGTLTEAEHELFSTHPNLLDDDIPDFFNNNIEEITSEKWNGFVTEANWREWHGEHG